MRIASEAASIAQTRRARGNSAVPWAREKRCAHLSSQPPPKSPSERMQTRSEVLMRFARPRSPLGERSKKGAVRLPVLVFGTKSRYWVHWVPWVLPLLLLSSRYWCDFSRITLRNQTL